MATTDAHAHMAREVEVDWEQTGTEPHASGSKPSHSANSAPAAAKTGIIQIQPVRREDMQVSFAQTLDDVEAPSFYGKAYHAIGELVGFFGQIPGCLCFPTPFREVPQGSVGMVTKWGRAVRTVDPGLARYNVCSESVRITNVQLQVTSLPKQQVLTRDNVKVMIDAVLTWQISSPYRATFGVADVRSALIERAQTTMRNLMGARNLQVIISDRESIASEIQEHVEEISQQWGINVSSIQIKDIELDPDTQELLSSAATQRRLGESKIIAARAEVESAKRESYRSDPSSTSATDALSSRAPRQ